MGDHSQFCGTLIYSDLCNLKSWSYTHQISAVFRALGATVYQLEAFLASWVSFAFSGRAPVWLSIR